jgi:hypothetical protein
MTDHPTNIDEILFVTKNNKYGEGAIFLNCVTNFMSTGICI